jgi:hypothetical protein
MGPLSRLEALVAAAAGVALAGLLVWAIVVGIDATVGAAVIAAAAGVAGAIYQRRWEKQQELARLHRAQMAPRYEELVSRFKKTEQDPDEVEQFFEEFSTSVLIYAPTEIVRAWLAFNRAYVPDDHRSLLLWEATMLRAIRRDLGHQDRKLPPGDLLRVYVTDLDAQLALWRQDGTLKPTRPPKPKQHWWEGRA